MEATVAEKDLLLMIAKAANNVPPPKFGQVGSSMVKLMGGNLDVDVVNDVLKLTDTTDELSETEVQNKKGILVSSDDLQNIFTYISTALKLPATETEAETYLGYKSSDSFLDEEAHKFLLPNKQVEFDKPIIENAKLWVDLEQSIKNTGNILNTYADHYVIQAKAVVEVLDDLETHLSKYKKINSLRDKSLDVKINTKEADEEGNDIVLGGAELLDNWKSETEANKKKSDDLYDRLTSFKNTIENTILPSVQKRKDSIGNLQLSNEQKTLKVKVDELTDEINRLEKEYSKLTGLAFTGAAGMILPPLGIISWAVTGGVFGAKAEKKRKKIKDKKSERAPLQEQLNAIDRVNGGIMSLETKLSAFQSSIDAALVGLGHLNTLWNSVITDITGALTIITKIDDQDYTSTIHTLRQDIKLAKTSWENCGDVTKQLVHEFDNARAQFNIKEKNGKKS